VSEIEDGEWNRLEQILCRDLMDLPFLTPKRLEHMIPILQMIIAGIIDEYFTRNPKYPYDHNLWSVKEDAITMRKELLADKDNKVANVEQERKKVAAKAAKTYRRERDNYERAHLAAEISNVKPPSGAVSPGAKRPRTDEEVDEDKKRIKRRNRVWKALNNIGSLYWMTDEYIEKFRAFEPPILDPAFWFDQEEEDNTASR
jgi:hypothetical protein